MQSSPPNLSQVHFVDQDPTAASRKHDHIALAFESQVAAAQVDARFYYEPLLSAHPKAGSWPSYSFLGYALRSPLWVSSMTGGTALAGKINHNLARVAGEFGFGMGLGSCRSLLSSKDTLADFDVRASLGDKSPLFANLGIAQLEQVLAKGQTDLVLRMLDWLRADGLIIHVNPLQEWLQPEGDRFEQPPLDTIQRCLDAFPDLPIIVKEVGQGMGKESLRALLQLPLAAVDFAANGGTNFAKLELLRSSSWEQDNYRGISLLGHSALDMVQMVNALLGELGPKLACQQIIISGGIQGFLDGYYLMKKLQLPSVYGQASAFLQYAKESYEDLYAYTATQIKGLELAQAFLRVRD
jgi:isopentenyl-diphosphate delta-isomerase